MKINAKLCRLCAENICDAEAVQLFQRKQRYLLIKIKDITGQTLNNGITLPKYVCPVCQRALNEAHNFRQKVLKAQLKLKSLHDSLNSKLKCNQADGTEFVQLYVDDTKSNKVNLNNEIENTAKPPEYDLCKKEKLGETVKREMETNASEMESSEENMLEVAKTILSDGDEKPYINTNAEVLISDVESITSAINDEEFKSIPETNEIKQQIEKCKKRSLDQPSFYICDQCGNNFTSRHHFRIHLRRHSGLKTCACELCPDKFFTNSELRRHMRRHTGERPFQCKFCQRRFSDYSTRVKHERTHTNERPFACTQCGKSFTTSYILKNHMLTHTGERQFQCEICKKSFTRRTHLVVHYRSLMHKQAMEKFNDETNNVKECPRNEDAHLSPTLFI